VNVDQAKSVEESWTELEVCT